MDFSDHTNNWLTIPVDELQRHLDGMDLTNSKQAQEGNAVTG